MNTYEQWIAFVTIVRKEISRYLRIWTQTLLPSAITMSLYFVIFRYANRSRDSAKWVASPIWSS